MKITHVSYERLDLQLANPYTIAYETIEDTTNFILTIETEGKIVGLGCAAPDPMVTGEKASQVEEDLKNFIVPYLKGKNPFRYALLLQELRVHLGKKSSALAMVDMALFDLMSRKAGVPLFQLLGGYRSCIATSVTIGILGLKETLARAREYQAQGFTILKIKGGIDLEADIEKMRRLHEEFPRLSFRFDGNQGYSVKQSLQFVNATKNIGIEIFEQPTKRESEEHLVHVPGETVPIMADESLKTLTDAFRLAQNQRIDMVNIKLQKVGGIMAGMHINSVAKAAGMDAMVGCIDECGLGIAAGLHFALSRPNISYADLDGNFDLINDPYTNLFQIKNGILYPTGANGLG